MKFLTFKVQKEAGFRFNLTDLLFIVLLISFSLTLYSYLETFYSLYLLPLYIGFTFFLFCNIFRVGTRLEIIWIGSFLIVSLMSHTYLDERWFATSAFISSFIQAIEVFITIQSKNYKGVFFEKMSQPK